MKPLRPTSTQTMNKPGQLIRGEQGSLCVVTSPPALPSMAAKLTRQCWLRSAWRCIQSEQSVRHNGRLQCRRSICFHSRPSVWHRCPFDASHFCLSCTLLEETVWEWTKLTTMLEVFKIYFREFLLLKLKMQVLLHFLHQLCRSLITEGVILYTIC